MTNEKPSAAPSRKTAKRSGFGRMLEKNLLEAAEHFRGERQLTEYVIDVPDTIDAAGIRTALGLSQAAFADRFGLDLSALQAWEQGRRRPDRTARIPFAVIQREPEAVMRALRVG